MPKEQFELNNGRVHVVCPSTQFPLPNDDAYMFHRDNTEEIKDKKILDIIDSIKVSLKTNAYESSVELYNALLSKGVKKADLQLITGWWFYPNGLKPDVTTALLYKDCHFIALNDLSENGLRMMTKGVSPFAPLEKKKKKMDKNFEKMAKKLKNSEYKLCGRMTTSIFVGAPVEESEVLDFYNKKNLYTGECVEYSKTAQVQNISSHKNEN